MSRWVACLDASVLIPQPTVDALLRLAEADIYRPVWSSQILDEVDEKDRHVVGTALVARAQVIVTSNVRDFAVAELPSELDLLVQTADEFLTDQWGIDRRAAAAALARQVEALRNPPRSLEEHVDALRAAQLESFAHAVENDLELIRAATTPASTD